MQQTIMMTTGKKPEDAVEFHRPGAPRYVLGVDIETTGLDTETCHIIEVGAVLWDFARDRPVRIFNELVVPEVESDEQLDGLIDEETTSLTGITVKDVLNHGVQPKFVAEELDRMDRFASSIWMAHNGWRFDFPILKRVLGVGPHVGVDSKIDVPYPDEVPVRRLRHLATEHKFLNPFEHRAVFDTLTMFQVVKHYDLDDVVARASSQMVRIQADVPYERKDEAKARGYIWDPDRWGAKIWAKEIRQYDLQAERRRCPFEVNVLEEMAA